MTTQSITNSIKRSPLWGGLLLIPLVLVCFALLPVARAVSPAPDGSYPGGNTAEGQTALLSLTTGGFNTAVGYLSLRSNTTHSFNTAIGAGALLSNNVGLQNTANGAFALFSNTSGSSNTAVGSGALFSNTNGTGNTANGWNALDDNTTGSFNIALGGLAGNLLTTGSYNIDIGNSGVAGESGTIRIGDQDHGATYIAGISGQTASGGVAVYVNTDGKLGTATSSARFKDEIKPMDKASEVILALKPVTFRYKKEIDSKGIPQFGLVAEEVEKVNADLVARDRDGKPYSVRYDAVNAMLLNEFLKEHRKVEEQQAAITDLRSLVARQQKQFEAAIAEQRKELEARLKQQDLRIQRVSDEVGLSKPAPQMAASDD